MTKNLTMTIDADVLKKARRIAMEKDTTVTGLIRNYLEILVEREEKTKQEILSELAGLFDLSNAEVGEKTWDRENLHER